jgi:hypothetical protein
MMHHISVQGNKLPPHEWYNHPQIPGYTEHLVSSISVVPTSLMRFNRVRVSIDIGHQNGIAAPCDTRVNASLGFGNASERLLAGPNSASKNRRGR